LIEKITAELDRRGFTTHIGIGPSQESAWLFSQTSLIPEVSQLDEGASLVARLGPIALNRLDGFEKDVSALNKAGVHRFGELLALPPESLKRRCSQTFCHWIDRLLCRVEVAVEDFHPEPEYSDIAWLGYGSTNNQELIYPMEQLLQDFSQFLRNTQLQTQHIRWDFIATQGESPQLHVHSSECHNDSARWLEQSRLKLEHLQFDDLIEGISLTACELSLAQLTTQDLFLESKHQEPLSQLIDRLRSRLGFQAVSHVYERAEHLPEHCSFVDSNQLDTPIAKAKNLRRPFWLLESPQPISQRGNQLYWLDALEIISGPERLEDCWWSQPTSRDYYIAKTGGGQPVWIFQDRHNRCWFLQGIFE
jgi:protein ImuB